MTEHPKEKEESVEFEIIEDQELSLWKKKAEQYIDNPAKTNNLLTKVQRKTENSKKNEVISNILDKIYLLFNLVKDWTNGNYRDISKKAIIAVIAGLIYFVSPIDLIPDIVVGMGLVDDAAVLGLIINQLDKELVRYQEWRKGKALR
ncbi:MAG: DUF1232 domain-containing protein [Peptococcaceae bacterium]|jgi:uncharacterized membrane protein YkvA (DUF1232 family)|nr:DUF1232 domain-containing protein [Peptococcaceae bacterium]